MAERYNFTESDEKVQEYIESSDTKAEAIREALRSYVYSVEEKPEGVDVGDWKVYKEWRKEYGCGKSYPIEEPLSGISAKMNIPKSVIRSRVKRLRNHGYVTFIPGFDSLSAKANAEPEDGGNAPTLKKSKADPDIWWAGEPDETVSEKMARLEQ